MQTPKKCQVDEQNKGSSVLCGDGDHSRYIKQLKDQLLEEELEKNSLQEQLGANIKRCNDLGNLKCVNTYVTENYYVMKFKIISIILPFSETKLKDKIEEINQLNEQWENESKQNEVEVNTLRERIEKKFEDEKKLKNELSYMESYISSLESDLSNCAEEKTKVEHEVCPNFIFYSLFFLHCDVRNLNNSISKVIFVTSYIFYKLNLHLQIHMNKLYNW